MTTKHRTALWLALALGATACRGGRTTESAGVDCSGDALEYAIDAARPPMRFTLVVPPSGDADLWLGAGPDAELGDTGGLFRAPVDPATRADLCSLVQRAPAGEATSSGEGSGHLRVTRGDSVRELSLEADGSRLLRAKLDAVIAATASHPFKAVKLGLALRREGTKVSSELVFTSVGAETFDGVLFEAGPFWLHGDLSDGASTASLSFADVDGLVSRGALPAGAWHLEAGKELRVPGPALTSGGSEITATATFWVPEGKSRRAVTLRAKAKAP